MGLSDTLPTLFPVGNDMGNCLSHEFDITARAEARAHTEENSARPLAARHAAHRPARDHAYPIRLAEVTGVLLQDFYARMVGEVSRKEHWDGASEYARDLARREKNPSASFCYSGSVEYQGSDQLIKLGLLREDRGWNLRRGAACGSPPGAVGGEAQQAGL
jgi:hypothetical protein